MMKLYEIVNARYEPKHKAPLYLIRVTVTGHTSFTSGSSLYTLWYTGNNNRFRKLEFSQSQNEAYCNRCKNNGICKRTTYLGF